MAGQMLRCCALHPVSRRGASSRGVLQKLPSHRGRFSSATAPSMTRRRARIASFGAAVGLSILVSGCASLPQGALDRTATGHTIEGRISVRYKSLATDKEDALSGRFVWTASGDDLELSLLDPLGQTVALVRSSPARSSITFRDGRRVDGATPESVTQQTLGWTVPLHGLRYWLEGASDPDSDASTTLDGRLRQGNWSIRFSGGDSPPKRIDLSYPGPPAEIDLRLVVDERSPT